MADEKFSKENVLKHAPLGVLRFCAACLCISFCVVWILISAKTVGIDFEPVFKAWTHSIHFETVGVVECPSPSPLETRIEALEEVSHPPASKGD